MHNVEKWSNIPQNVCGVQTARFFKYACFIIMYRGIKYWKQWGYINVEAF